LPVEFVPELIPPYEVSLPDFTGHLTRGALLNMLRRGDASLPDRLHVPNVSKPYSVTGLYFRSKFRLPGRYILDPARPCTFKIRLLDDEIAQTVMKCFQDRDTVKLANSEFRIARVRVSGQSYADILRNSAPSEAFRLVFKSPTYLASRGTEFHCLFPEPRRVFLHLAKLWKQHARGFEVDDLDDYAAWLRRNSGVSGHAIRTMIIRMGTKEAIGFVGWTNYRLAHKDRWSAFTQALGRFAEYSNIGANRTGGFGVVKYFPNVRSCPPTITSSDIPTGSHNRQNTY